MYAEPPPPLHHRLLEFAARVGDCLVLGDHDLDLAGRPPADVVYEGIVGPIGVDRHVITTCEIEACVNPWHLAARRGP